MNTQIYLEGNTGTGWQFAGACKTVDEAQAALLSRQKAYPECQWRIAYPTESARMNTHSPLPWKVSVMERIIGSDDLYIGHTSSMTNEAKRNRSNAQFIVTACNSHQALVEALEKMLSAYEALRETYGYNAPMDGDESFRAGAWMEGQFASPSKSARAALALAKGEQK